MEFRQSTRIEMLLPAQDLLEDGTTFYEFRCLVLEKNWTAHPVVQASGSPQSP